MRFLVDGHQDIAMVLLRETQRDFGAPSGAGRALSLPEAKRAGLGAILATIFAPRGFWDDEAPAAAARRQVRLYDELVRRFDGDLLHVATRSDLAGCRAAGPIGLVRLMEGADPVESPDEVAWWATEGGVRFVGLAWSTSNRYSGGTKGADGISAEGRALLAAMRAAGVVPDASHLNENALDDLLAFDDGLVVASHSNAWAVREKSRNLKDRHIRAIAERGGVIGLMLYGPYLGEARTTLDDVARHVDHIVELVGVEHVGLGSDLDGGFSTDMAPDGIGSVADLPRIGDVLLRRGYTSEQVDSVLGASWMRVLREVLPA